MLNKFAQKSIFLCLTLLGTQQANAGWFDWLWSSNSDQSSSSSSWTKPLAITTLGLGAGYAALKCYQAYKNPKEFRKKHPKSLSLN